MSTSRTRAALDSDPSDRAANLASCVKDQWFDRTSARIKPKDLGPALTAFANAEGGVLVLGLGESIPEPDRLLREWQQAAVDFTVPPVRAHVSVAECLDAEGATSWIGVIEVESSEGVHETQDGTCFLRIGDETRKLSFTQRQELHFDKGQSSFDGQPLLGGSIADLDRELVESYRVSAGTRLDADTLLTNRGLLTRDGAVTNAGILLFGSAPQELLANSDIRVLKYRGRDRGHGRSLAVDADSDIRLEGTLPEQIEAASAILDEWVPARRALAGGGLSAFR